VRKRLHKLREKVKGSFDSESKVLIKNSRWVFTANFIGALYAFVKSILIARGLGADFLGVFTLSIAFVLTIQEILKLNTAMAVIRFGAIYRTQNRPDKIVGLIRISAAGSLASALLSVMVIAVIVSFFYQDFVTTPGLAKFILLYAVVNGFSFLDNISRSALKLFYKFRLNSMVQILMDSVEFLLVAGVLYFYPRNLEAFFITVISARFLNSMICNGAAFIELKNELGQHLSMRIGFLREEVKSIFQFVVGQLLSRVRSYK